MVSRPTNATKKHNFDSRRMDISIFNAFLNSLNGFSLLFIYTELHLPGSKSNISSQS